MKPAGKIYVQTIKCVAISQSHMQMRSTSCIFLHDTTSDLALHIVFLTYFARFLLNMIGVNSSTVLLHDCRYCCKVDFRV